MSYLDDMMRMKSRINHLEMFLETEKIKLSRIALYTKNEDLKILCENLSKDMQEVLKV